MRIAFLGGGNMAAALIGGLLRAGRSPADLCAVEIDAARCAQLRQQFGINAVTAPDATLNDAVALVLAVKPQHMREACEAARPHVREPLVVSIAAGTRSADIARWLGRAAIVRTMPNTPALIGRGVTGMAATGLVSSAQRELAASILRTAGDVLWLDDEAQLDAVTAVSGSGPAYVFYFIEALRNRVTSKGGTTAAALAWLESNAVAARIVEAVHAAHRRASELGDEFGRQ